MDEPVVQSSTLSADPRSDSGFIPRHFPLANGQSAPPSDAADRSDRIRVEFLAAYYHINCAYARLIEFRQSGGQRGEPERKLLQDIEVALRARDALEDKYAPEGVIAEPVTQQGYTVNLLFSFGVVQSRLKQTEDGLFSSTVILIPLPAGVSPTAPAPQA